MARLLLAMILLAACSRQTQPAPVTTAPPVTTTTTANGSLDCSTDEVFTMQASVLPDTVGAPTPEQELEGFLSQWVTRYGGEAVVFGETSGALVVNGEEKVVAFASRAPAGGWIVLTTNFCPGYRL